MLPKNRPPTSAGEMIVEEFLKPLKMTQGDLAKKMGVPIQRVNQIINEKRAVTAETAILLSKTLGTSPELWMGLQSDWDLWHSQRKTKARITRRRVKRP